MSPSKPSTLMSRRMWGWRAATMFAAGGFAPNLKAAPRPVVSRPFTVVIDPGHGGDNFGCLAFDRQTHEKTVTLALGRALAQHLAKILPPARILLTRSDDRFLPLAARVVMANDEHADLFLSLHANASPSRAQEGFETWVLEAGLAERDAAWLAHSADQAADQGANQSANQSVSRSESTTLNPALRMIDHLTATAHRSQALWFAQTLQREAALRFPRRPDRGVRAAAFDVLVGLRMPAVLHEFGFLDHAEDGALLLDPAAQRSMVEAIGQALSAYYRLLAFGL